MTILKCFLLGARDKTSLTFLLCSFISLDCKQKPICQTKTESSSFFPSLYASLFCSTPQSPWSFHSGPCLVVYLYPCFCLSALSALGRHCSTKTGHILCTRPWLHWLQLPCQLPQLPPASPFPRAAATWRAQGS